MKLLAHGHTAKGVQLRLTPGSLNSTSNFLTTFEVLLFPLF